MYSNTNSNTLYVKWRDGDDKNDGYDNDDVDDDDDDDDDENQEQELTREQE